MQPSLLKIYDFQLLFPSGTERDVNATNAFTNCKNLTNIEAIEGTILALLNFQWSPLNVDTMRRIIEHLADCVGTPAENEYYLYFSEDCWTKLEASGTAPDGGTWKDYVRTKKGWII